MLECAAEAARNHRDRVVTETEKFKQLLLDEGMEYTDVDVEPFRQACTSVWEEYKSNVDGGAEMIEYVQGLAK